MNATTNTPPSAKSGWLRPRHVLAVLFVALLAAIGVWAFPRRIERIVSADGVKSWDARQAPPRQTVIWEAPHPVVPGRGGSGALTTPRLADEGQTLYFTRRLADGHADICRCRRIAGAWSIPEPVREWTTAADEIGPAFSPDGKLAVFCSNRSPGEGGYDLYLSERKGRGWGPPRNLGPTVNSPGDDVEPAIAFDGRLFFSSNRGSNFTAPSPDDRPADAAVSSSYPANPAHAGSKWRGQFDVYSAYPEYGGESWSAPEPLLAINRLGSNERAPFLSPQGTSLYFASDRPGFDGANANGNLSILNFDLYRVAWNGARFERVENLGPEINTTSDETGVGLSSEGFTLLFSSNRTGTDALFQSRAVEVFQTIGWDTSRLEALAGIWRPVVFATLGGMALILIQRICRWRPVVRRPTLPNRGLARRPVAWSPFACSVAIHCLLCLGLTFVPLATIVVDKNGDVGGALDTLLFGQSLRPPEKKIAAEFTKLADLRSDEVLLVPAVERQETEPRNLPKVDQKTEMPLPRQAARRLIPGEIEIAQETPRGDERPLQLDRRARQRPLEVAQADDAAPAEVIPAQAVEERPLAAPPAMLERQPPAAAELIPDHPGEPVAPRRIPQQTVEVRVRRDGEPAPLPEAKPIPLAVTRPRPRVKDPGDDPLQLDTVAASTKTPETATADPAAISVPRIEREVETPSKMDLKIDVGRPAAALHSQNADEVRRTSAVDDRVEPKPSRLEMLAGSTRREAPRRMPATEVANAIDPAGSPAGSPVETPVRGAQIALERGNSASPAVAPGEAGKPDDPSNKAKSRLIVGARGDARVDSPPSIGPAVSLGDRFASRARRVAVVEENVGMEAMFSLRRSETRREFIDLFGGSEASEASVERGLAWLAAHQESTGFWSLEKHSANSRSDTAGAGLALLPFLAAGHTSQAGTYREHVERGLKWLIATQKPDGDLMSKDDNSHWRMYAHAIATIALCEAYGITKQAEFKEPTQRALDFIVKSQNASTGGWRYQPQEAGDTSVVGWMVMALKSGEMAGLAAPPAAYLGAQRWLDSVEANKPVGGQFGYLNATPTASMTAEGLLCLQFMGTPRNHPRIRAGADFILANLPDAARDTSYYWYYGTQMMYHMQGEYWRAWNGRLRDMLIATQVKEGPNAGTWDPRDPREVQGGRLYTTTLKLLMLEIYYRHLPLYQQLEE